MATRQQLLNEQQFTCLARLMTLVVECEGGHIDISEDGAHITTLIPEALWCSKCISLMERVVELRVHWEKLNKDSKKYG